MIAKGKEIIKLGVNFCRLHQPEPRGIDVGYVEIYNNTYSKSIPKSLICEDSQPDMGNISKKKFYFLSLILGSEMFESSNDCNLTTTITKQDPFINSLDSINSSDLNSEEESKIPIFGSKSMSHKNITPKNKTNSDFLKTTLKKSEELIERKDSGFTPFDSLNSSLSFAQDLEESIIHSEQNYMTLEGFETPKKESKEEEELEYNCVSDFTPNVPYSPPKSHPPFYQRRNNSPLQKPKFYEAPSYTDHIPQSIPEEDKTWKMAEVEKRRCITPAGHILYPHFTPSPNPKKHTLTDYKASPSIGGFTTLSPAQPHTPMNLIFQNLERHTHSPCTPKFKAFPDIGGHTPLHHTEIQFSPSAHHTWLSNPTPITHYHPYIHTPTNLPQTQQIEQTEEANLDEAVSKICPVARDEIMASKQKEQGSNHLSFNSFNSHNSLNSLNSLNSHNLHSSLNSFESTPQNISNSQNLSSNFSFQNQNAKKSVGKTSISSDEFRHNSEIISGEFNLGGRNSITSQSRFFPHQNSSGDEASLNGFGELSIEEDLIKNERISTKLAELRKKYPDISEQALMDIFTQGLFESNKQ